MSTDLCVNKTRIEKDVAQLLIWSVWSESRRTEGNEAPAVSNISKDKLQWVRSSRANLRDCHEINVKSP